MLSDSNGPSQAPTCVAAPTQSHLPLAAPDLPRFGVGIDTSRYGHYAAFLRDDLQPAADELSFAESADGYAQLRARLERIAERCGPCRRKRSMSSTKAVSTAAVTSPMPGMVATWLSSDRLR
jgi:hypothetical protein